MVNFCAAVGWVIARSDRDKVVRSFRLPLVISHQGEITHDLSDGCWRQWPVRCDLLSGGSMDTVARHF